jgi:hypothetical protein
VEPLRRNNPRRHGHGPLKLWITGPKGDLGGLRPALERQWLRVAQDANVDLADVNFVEPRDHEIHGEMLSRLWVEEVRDSADPEHLLSEIDFIPCRNALNFLSQAPFHLIGAKYVRREYPPGANPLHGPGEVKTYEMNGLPLIAPWFLYLRLSPQNSTKLPPETWLQAGGEFNDAANLALHHAIQAGFVREEDFALLPGKDAWPRCHGVWYPKVGTHAFFASSLGAPADKELCWGLKAGDHFSNVRALLR